MATQSADPSAVAVVEPDKIVTSPPDGVRKVPESDLMAVKQLQEGTAKELAEAKSSNALLQASLKAAEGKVQESSGHQGELETLKGTHALMVEELTRYKEADLTTRRQGLVVRGVEEEKVKSLSESEISVLEAHLPAKVTTPTIPKNGFDLTGQGGGGDPKDLSAFGKIASGLSSPS